MAYATVTDIRNEFKNSPAGSATPQVAIEDFLTQASEYIDTKLRFKYGLPIVDGGALAELKRICVALVAYRVATIQTVNKDSSTNTIPIHQSNPYYQAYKDAKEQLEDLRLGKSKLGSLNPSTKRSLYYSEYAEGAASDPASDKW